MKLKFPQIIEKIERRPIMLFGLVFNDIRITFTPWAREQILLSIVATSALGTLLSIVGTFLVGVVVGVILCTIASVMLLKLIRSNSNANK